MNDSNNNLPNGFVSVQEAIDLIRSDTRQKPVVDMDYMISRVVWIEPDHNFRIPLIKRLDTPTRDQFNRPVEFQNTGSVYVAITSNLDKELLRQAIMDKYKELVGHDYSSRSTKTTSTVVDDGEGLQAARPRDIKPLTEAGSQMSSGISTTNADGLQL